MIYIVYLAYIYHDFEFIFFPSFSPDLYQGKKLEPFACNRYGGLKNLAENFLHLHSFFTF